MKKSTKKALTYFAISASLFATGVAVAGPGGGGGGGIGTVAATVTSQFGALAKLITAGSYIGGLGAAIGGIMKLKAHKDNPTQIPIGTPIFLIVVAVLLLFLPSLMASSGKTLFTNGGKTAGVAGITSFQS